MARPFPLSDEQIRRWRDEDAERYRKERMQRGDPYRRWIMLIKELRVTHGCSVLEAEMVALSYPHVRRYVERAINTDNPSRKRALAHIRHNGPASLIERLGDSFVFRIPPP